MRECLNLIDTYLEREETILPRLREGTSQYSLVKNRIRSLRTARELLSGAGQPCRGDLEFALPRIHSILHKTRKARDKYESGSRTHSRLDPVVRTMEQISAEVERALECSM